jgi:oxygen-independent coproporphyrinogen-3 oxidase
MGKQGAVLLEKNGFVQYEVSAYGKSPSIHNLNYWQFGDYLGIGAGAHGKITNIDTGQVLRTVKPKSPKDYIDNQKGSIELVNNLSFEFMLNALRLKQGFNSKLFINRTGQSIDTIMAQLQKAQSIGLLKISKTKIEPTEKGFDFLNDLQAYFL